MICYYHVNFVCGYVTITVTLCKYIVHQHTQEHSSNAHLEYLRKQYNTPSEYDENEMALTLALRVCVYIHVLKMLREKIYFLIFKKVSQRI